MTTPFRTTAPFRTTERIELHQPVVADLASVAALVAPGAEQTCDGSAPLLLQRGGIPVDRDQFSTK